MSGELTAIAMSLEAGPNSDDEARIVLTRRLRQNLLDLSEVESVESPAVPIPPGSKAVGINLQTLIVTLAASGGVLTTLVGTIQAWLTRHERASVTLKIDGDELVVTGASPETQRRLVNDWIRRHGH